MIFENTIWIKNIYYKIIKIYKNKNFPILLYNNYNYNINLNNNFIIEISKWLFCIKNNYLYYNCKKCKNCINYKNINNIFIIDKNIKFNILNIIKNSYKNKVLIYIYNIKLDNKFIKHIFSNLNYIKNKNLFFIFHTKNLYNYMVNNTNNNLFYKIEINYPYINKFKKNILININKNIFNKELSNIRILHFLYKILDIKEIIFFINNLNIILINFIKIFINKDIFSFIYYIKRNNLYVLSIIKYLLIIFIEIINNRCYNFLINNKNKKIYKYIEIISKYLNNKILFNIIDKLFLYIYYINNDINNLLNKDILISYIFLYILKKTK
ncbi:hypothetical protein [Candidatus Nardonella dryophthoridicola]|uniref:Uncharacterized protein n=1 Tax=endosymbiont of Rhynchophorus ferrugineus TaxID=1972133 RepID=A0A2Z5TI98_9GAMM|nr:hypothetical protein [Candidatus Nardonella dryophthoridicola]BBA85002.1 hypothetical protein NARRFE1_00430 [endosymbiont of Rhynchophorus ferrugineus]